MSKNAKGIVSYLLIAFGLAWGFWGILFSIGITPRDPRFQIWGTIPGFAPAIAAIIVRKWVTREGFADAGLRPNLKNWRYYLLAWLLPLGIASIITGLAVILRIGTPDPTLQRAYKVLSPAGGPPSLLLNLPLPVFPLLLTMITTFLIWGEEFGWRGYLQIRLFADRPVLAGLATGLIWGIWHIPMILASGDQYADNAYIGLLVFPISAALLSVFWGWLRMRTGSVWVCCVAHAATNSFGSLMMISLFYGAPNWTFTSYFGILGWVPLGMMCAYLVATGRMKPDASNQVPCR
jgi:membrane protease YdiL (CAAX protease family)